VIEKVVLSTWKKYHKYQKIWGVLVMSTTPGVCRVYNTSNAIGKSHAAMIKVEQLPIGQVVA
jgi:hypothetical protein